ncbi:MAG: serine/threonine protein kinase [Planctomycetes bacterium]|nr:serine/threonine protein kinase [Planctomycetota bacterium]
MRCVACGMSLAEVSALSAQGTDCPYCGRPVGGSNAATAAPAQHRTEAGAPGRGSTEAETPEAASRVAGAPPGTGRVLAGRYRLLSVLGAGGMGVVWKAHDASLDRVVAVKLLQGLASWGGESLSRFQREARLAAGLRHPGIVAVHDVGEAEGRPFLVMDCIEGETFRTFLKESEEPKRRGLAPRMARLRQEVWILAEVAEAVAYAHEHGVIHRDVKPSNILLDAEGRSHVMDFGLAREVEPGPGAAKGAGPRHGDPDRRAPHSPALTLTGQALGTPAYMSPEQAQGRLADIGPATDVWALGATLFEVLTGEPPFARAGSPVRVLRAVVDEDVEPPRDRNRHVPADLEAVCLAALRKEPRRRHRTAREFAEELRRWLVGEPVRARRLGRVERTFRFVRRHGRVPTAVMAISLALVAILGIPVFQLLPLARQWEHGRVAACGVMLGCAALAWVARDRRSRPARALLLELAQALEGAPSSRRRVSGARDGVDWQVELTGVAQASHTWEFRFPNTSGPGLLIGRQGFWVGQWVRTGVLQELREPPCARSEGPRIFRFPPAPADPLLRDPEFADALNALDMKPEGATPTSPLRRLVDLAVRALRPGRPGESTGGAGSIWPSLMALLFSRRNDPDPEGIVWLELGRGLKAGVQFDGTPNHAPPERLIDLRDRLLRVAKAALRHAPASGAGRGRPPDSPWLVVLAAKCLAALAAAAALLLMVSAITVGMWQTVDPLMNGGRLFGWALGIAALVSLTMLAAALRSARFRKALGPTVAFSVFLAAALPSSVLSRTALWNGAPEFEARAKVTELYFDGERGRYVCLEGLGYVWLKDERAGRLRRGDEVRFRLALGPLAVVRVLEFAPETGRGEGLLASDLDPRPPADDMEAR